MPEDYFLPGRGPNRGSGAFVLPDVPGTAEDRRGPVAGFVLGKGKGEKEVTIGG